MNFKKFQYSLEIVGSCNLRCPSCPVGNINSRTIGKEMISEELFCKIIDKIDKEKEVDSPLISLFDWGEPTLHPKLPFFIKYVNEKNFKSRISSNLNVDADFEQILKSEPFEFKISLSGFYQEQYGRTHYRGNINKVKSNMYKLKMIKDKLKIKTKFIVGYHVYKHNLLKDYDEMQKLCKELDFEFEPDIAQLMPIEKMFSLVLNKDENFNFKFPKITDQDKKLIKLLLSDPVEEHKKWMKKSIGEKDQICFRKDNKLPIRVDGSIPICCGVYGDDYIVENNFLEASHKKIQEKRDKYDLCGTCIKNGIHNNYKLSKRTMINKLILKDNALGKLMRRAISM